MILCNIWLYFVIFNQYLVKHIWHPNAHQIPNMPHAPSQESDNQSSGQFVVAEITYLGPGPRISDDAMSDLEIGDPANPICAAKWA